jgi:large subunit ribosomal protein L9
MKLILTQEVGGLGAPGDIVEVKDGYGRNYLVPRGFAIRWTRGAESQVAQIRRGREVREIRDLGQAQEVANQLAALSVKLPARAGQGGRLFGSVTAADVVEAVRSAGGPSLDKRRVELPAAHIKSVGTHTVSVRLHPDVAASVSVEVVAES